MSSKIGAGAAFGGSPVPTVTGAEGTGAAADINVTPMIDVMLVLLIIFMVITPALGGYTLILPKAVTAAPEKDDRVTLGISDAGLFYLEDNPAGQVAIPPEQLPQVLAQAYATRPEDHILYLKAHNQAEYSLVLTAIDAARQAGVVRIGAITELPKDQATN